MGLDMYLIKKTFVGAVYELQEFKGNIDLEIRGKKIPIDTNRIDYISEQIGYWRKANAIHAWFVKNCQDGVDDCRDAYVGKSELKTLLELCREVKKHPRKAQELLPTQSGFFFGSTEYDEWYLEDIDNTIRILEAALAENMDFAEYSYHSSW